MPLRTYAFLLITAVILPAADYFPAAQWRTATPESQGIDSAALTAALDQVTQKQLGVHSVLVIRHGYQVLDAYFYPYNAAVPHEYLPAAHRSG